jgi:hypothetical protein
VNHRSTATGRSGHFSVLTQVTAEVVRLNDPLVGPRELGVEQFFRLWGSASLAVPGQVVVVIGRTCQRPVACSLCETEPPTGDVECPGCRRSIPLQPFAVLGCVRKNCPMRSWERLFCPWCDAKIEPDMSSRV